MMIGKNISKSKGGPGKWLIIYVGEAVPRRWRGGFAELHRGMLAGIITGGPKNGIEIARKTVSKDF
jgi:hypothetical protein